MISILSRWQRGIFLALVCVFDIAAATQAQPSNYPGGKQVRLVVPYAPGGAADIVARLLAEELSAQIPASFYVENRPGADGAIGERAVATAKPDGLTLLITVTSAHTLTPLLHKGSIDPIKDFEPISIVSKLGVMAVVRDDFPAKTFPDYVAYAKAHPSSMGSSTSGIQLTSEKLKRDAGLSDVVIVPYNGPVYPALMTGEIDMTLDPFNSIAMIKAGKIRPLAMLADKRNPEFPDVPTFAELGYKDIRYSSWTGVLAPAGTPRPIIDELNSAIASAMQSSKIRQRFREQHYEIVLTTPEEFSAQIAADIDDWKTLIASTPPADASR